MTGRQNWNPPAPIDESKLATPHENLAFARGVVARLYGDDELEPSEAGECDDCRRVGTRFVFGRVLLCRLCARSRRRAKRRALGRTA